jgi:hypothetical protein
LERELNPARPPAGIQAVRPGDVAQRGLVPGAELPLGRRAGHVEKGAWGGSDSWEFFEKICKHPDHAGRTIKPGQAARR